MTQHNPKLADAVARVRAFLYVSEREPHPFQEEFSPVHTLEISDIALLLDALDTIEQGDQT